MIKAETAARQEGEKVVIDMNGAGVVPGDIFDAIRGKDIDIEFEMDNGVSWQINGKSVQTGEVKDIDFTVRYGREASDTIPVDIINGLTGKRSSLNVTLAYEGTFGFEAVLRINVGTENKGMTANLFYYNEDTGAMEFISAGQVDEEGYARLSFTHASDYAIVIDTSSMEGQEASAGASGTAARTALIWIIALAAIAAATAVVIALAKKRKEEKQ